MARIELAVGVPFGTVSAVAVGDVDVADAVAGRNRAVSDLLGELAEARGDLAGIATDGDAGYVAERAALAAEHVADLEARLDEMLRRGRVGGR